jgi:UDP-GlcNAc:undecaprenyl-phosphate/decaprenyl-phosphate GlcNAc-1-phosphate transferase
MQPEITAVSIAFLATLVATIPVRRLALYVGLVDKPGPRKVHLDPIPLLGGLAIYIGVILAVMLVHRGPIGQIVGILAGATMLALVGILDDGGLLHHQIKLLLAMPIASVLLLVSGIRARVFAPLIPGPVGAILDIGFTIFWVTGITAAFSILDHMDGLCAGVGRADARFFPLAAV